MSDRGSSHEHGAIGTNLGVLISERPTSTRDAIIRGAWLCFQEKGPDRTTIAAVSRRAGVSRGTVYQYFPDKEALFRATAEEASGAFYEALANEIASASTLREQIESVAAFIAQSKQWLPAWGAAFDAERVALLTTIHSGVILADFIAFLTPYLDIARTRGEVRKDLDVRGAAEWLARLLFSLFSTPSPHLDLADPDVVRSFVGDFAVAGLQPHTQSPTGRHPTNPATIASAARP